MIKKEKKVRISAKALVISGGRILLMKARDQRGDYYLLPGGGQKNGESLTEALKRECLEETGAEVIPGELRYVRDYISDNHEFAASDPGFHQVELMFRCRFRRQRKNARLVPDNRQTGSEWVPLDTLSTLRIYPSVLKTLISGSGKLNGPIYLGDVN